MAEYQASNQDNNPSLRLPPQFLEGERAILGGLLIDNSALSKVMGTLETDDFYREGNRLIFQSMKELFEQNEPVDWLTLSEQLRRNGTLESSGGLEYLTELSDAVPSAANILHYMRQVKERSILRKLIGVTAEISTRCYDQDIEIDEFLDEAEKLIFQIGETRLSTGFTHIEPLMKSSLKTIESLYDKKEHVTGVPSGFKDLDNLTAGFQSGDLIIVAGRPSMGKTSLALNFAMNASDVEREDQTPIAVFSLEMSKEQLALRLLCATARVNLKSLRTGYLSREDWSALALAAGKISDQPIFIDDTPSINTLEIRAKARRLKKEHGVGLIVVDYLQLMKGGSRSESREKEISEISRSLKALAKELDTPVVALSQLNRKVEDRPNKRPQLADLRESGAIEQDADVIIFLYRDEVYNKSEDNPKKGEAEIIIGKQRNGPIGTVSAYFDAQYSTFRQRSFREEPADIDDSILSSL